MHTYPFSLPILKLFTLPPLLTKWQPVRLSWCSTIKAMLLRCQFYVSPWKSTYWVLAWGHTFSHVRTVLAWGHTFRMFWCVPFIICGSAFTPCSASELCPARHYGLWRCPAFDTSVPLCILTKIISPSSFLLQDNLSFKIMLRCPEEMISTCLQFKTQHVYRPLSATIKMFVVISL